MVVPVGTSQPGFTRQQLQTTLNNIYAQAVVEWEVTFQEALPLGGIDDLSQGITVPSTDYSEHMRSVWRALVMNRNPLPGASYIFVVPGFEGNSGMDGYMPLKSGYGFITPTTSPELVAHELGHGAFNLRHTFSEYNVFTLPPNTTANLMDYPSAGNSTELWKYQWDFIHDPEGGWFLWEDVDEGATYSGHLAMTLNKTEFSDENRVNITTFIDQANSVAYHGNGGSPDNISISIQPYFEPMDDNTANGFYAKVKVYTNDAETPHFTGEPQRIRKPLVGGGGLYRPNNAWEFTLPDQVGFYPDFKIEYYASLTEDGEYEKMEEEYSGRLYTLFNVPRSDAGSYNPGPELDERLMYFSCQLANGVKNEDELIQKIWAKFSFTPDNNDETTLPGNLYVSDFYPSDSLQLKYYSPFASATRYYSQLLLTTNGDCEAFSDLLRFSLLLQGINVSQFMYLSPIDAESILISKWHFVGDGSRGTVSHPVVNALRENGTFGFVQQTGEYRWNSNVPPDVERRIKDEANAAAHGNRHPLAHFGKHYMVKIGTQIYDPSYGMIYNSVDSFVNAVIDGYYKVDEDWIGEIDYKLWLIREQK